MNPHFHYQGELEAAPNLYQEPTAGTHFLLRKDSRTAFMFRAANPFLSTGNFDQMIGTKQTQSKTFMSCGNFQTSTRLEEGWDDVPDEFRIPNGRFAQDSLSHNPQNVKYNVGKEIGGMYQKRTTNRVVPRSYSDDQIDAPEGAGPVVQNIALTKPNKNDYPRILQGEPLKQETRPKKHMYKVQECVDDDDDDMSNNEYELKSNPQEDDDNGNENNNKHQTSATRTILTDPSTRPFASQETFLPSDPYSSGYLGFDMGPIEKNIKNMLSYELLGSKPSRGLLDDRNESIMSRSRPESNRVLDHTESGSLSGAFESIKGQCMSQLLNKKSSKRNDQSSILEEEDIDPSESYNSQELLEMALYSKESSIKVQSYMRSLDNAQFNHYASYLCKNIDILILNKFGNYVVQFLAEAHRPTRETVSHMTLNSFVKFAENEYGSRIMQKLCTISPEYCFKALNLFHKNFDRLIRNITGSILLSKLISASPKEQDYLFAIKILEQNKEYLRKAYFNRMLSTLVSCCSEQTLQLVVSLIKNHIWILMNDKFGNYVLQILIERGNTAGTNLIKSACLKNANVILTRKYPKFLLIKIVDLDEDASFSTEMMQRVMELDDESLLEILTKRDALMLLMLVLCKQPSAIVTKIVSRIIRVSVSCNGSDKSGQWKGKQTIDQDLLESLEKLKQMASQQSPRKDKRF